MPSEYVQLDCQTCREALSARLDGETEPGAPALVGAHVSTCPACREWQQDAAAMSRFLRVGPAAPVPDFTHLAVDTGATASTADPEAPQDPRTPGTGHAAA